MKKICERLLNFVQIIDHKGTVRLCGWLKNSVIGELSCKSMKDIYHGEHAEELRDKLSRGDYSLCDVDACPYLAMDDMESHLVEFEELPEYPTELYLAFEEICNYHCTSCFVHDVMIKNRNVGLEKAYDAIEAQLKEVLPHVKRIGANGCGELFVSRRILKLLAEWKPLAPAEEVSVFLETNGSLFDEEHWKQIENLGQYHLRVTVTVMSFDEPAYQMLSGTKLPISRIENNLRFIKGLRERGIVNEFYIATVVQERNFRFLPEFTRRCIEEFGADYIRLRPYEPWGAREPEIEWFYDVRNPRHPYYQEYREIMKDEIFRHPSVHDWSGGKDTVNIREFPYSAYKFSHYVEGILTDMLLNPGRILKRLEDKMGKGRRLIIYGLGSVGKALAKQLSQSGLEPLYILDRNKPFNEWNDITIYSLEETEPLEKEADVLITPLRHRDLIMDDLNRLGYRGNFILVQELLENRPLAEEISSNVR